MRKKERLLPRIQIIGKITNWKRDSVDAIGCQSPQDFKKNSEAENTVTIFSNIFIHVYSQLCC